MRICINHLFRPKKSFKIEGCGDCANCIPNEDNKKCKNYKEVKLTLIE